MQAPPFDGFGQDFNPPIDWGWEGWGVVGFKNSLFTDEFDNPDVSELSSTFTPAEQRYELTYGEIATQMNGEGVWDSTTATKEQSTNRGGSVNGVQPPQHEFAKQTFDIYMVEADEVESSETDWSSPYRPLCPYPLCSQKFDWRFGYSKHASLAHPEMLRCHQCGHDANGYYYLQWEIATKHANTTGHSAFLCPDPECATTFSRIDVLKRHFATNHNANAERYPCYYCKKYRGCSAFKRKDHLMQHLRGYHNFDIRDANGTGKSCPYPACEAYRAEDLGLIKDLPFKKQSEYTAHMRKVHDESPFPCTVPNCDRIHGKGFYREKDYLKHVAKRHPELAE